jgi:hypothetical protein
MRDELAHQRINNVEKTLDTHFQHITKLEEVIALNTSSLSKNTELTQEIANNTSELVGIIKGVKGIRQFIVWLAPVVLLIIAVVTYFKSS